MSEEPTPSQIDELTTSLVLESPAIFQDPKPEFPQEPVYSESVERLLDVPLIIEVELARIKMMFKDAAALGTGSIVELDTVVGELVNVTVDGEVVARGEVIIVEESFGVRIKEILSPEDRIRRLATLT